jgi:pimeloyl-ACP methyl ester carboxylesterase
LPKRGVCPYGVGIAPTRTFLLLPGAGGESWYWHRVVPVLHAEGHEVISPDLPAADDAAGFAEYAEVAWNAIGDRGGLVVVAQSLAAFFAPLLCDRADVRQLILIAPMIPAPGESPGEWWTSSGQLEAMREQDKRDGRDPDAPFDVMTAFFHDVPEEVVAEAFARGEPRQSSTPMGQTWPLKRWPAVPTSVIAGSRDRLFPLEFMRGLARARLGVDVDVIDSGHLPALARPNELTERLLAHAS